MTTPDATPLPMGARIVHIGPHKTGTTAIQASLWAARDALARQRIKHAGGGRNPAAAARAVVGQRSPYAENDQRPPMWRWHRLAADIRGAGSNRVIVSSEFFAYADREAIERIAEDLGREQLHVIVTLRPLGRVLTSMWQQNVQGGTLATLDVWLRGVVEPELGRTDEASRAPLWTLQRHDELISRWAAVLGADRVTAVVVDDRDHGFLLRAFEALLGADEATLQPQVDLTNRSLTLPEVEAVRAFNRSFLKDRKLSRGRHARLMRFGAAQVMKEREPAADEPRVELPAWSLEPIATIQRRVVDGVRASGVRIVGDLDRLLQPMRAADDAHEIVISPEIAAAMAMGIVVAAGEARRGGQSRLEIAEPTQVADVPTYQLAGVMGLRAVRSVTRTIRGPARWAGRLLGRKD